DNSSAISLPFDPRPSSAQHLRLDIRQRLLELQHSHPQLSITLHWIAGHEGVEGNELADETARRGSEDGIEATAAAQATQGKRRRMVMPREAIERSLSSLDDGGSSYWEMETSAVAATCLRRGDAERPDLGRANDEGRIDGGDSLLKSAASVIQAAKAVLKSQWEQEWASTTVGAVLRAIDPLPPSSAFRWRLRSLPRPQATLLSRLEPTTPASPILLNLPLSTPPASVNVANPRLVNTSSSLALSTLPSAPSSSPPSSPPSPPDTSLPSSPPSPPDTSLPSSPSSLQKVSSQRFSPTSTLRIASRGSMPQ
ncbi:hypothetical protein JCM11641_007570, partial [Rhodosporidiobolus odoratus]